jgi:hypothetical protein
MHGSRGGGSSEGHVGFVIVPYDPAPSTSFISFPLVGSSILEERQSPGRHHFLFLHLLSWTHGGIVLIWWPAGVGLGGGWADVGMRTGFHHVCMSYAGDFMGRGVEATWTVHHRRS